MWQRSAPGFSEKRDVSISLFASNPLNENRESYVKPPDTVSTLSTSLLSSGLQAVAPSLKAARS
jgi:hypothetical protein